MDQAAAKPERRLAALALSRGIGIGRVVFSEGEKKRFSRLELDPPQVDLEVSRLSSAVNDSIGQLRKLSIDNDSDTAQGVSGIFGVHLLILEESSFVEKIATLIREQKVNAEWALQTISDQYVSRQGSIADAHFQEKYLDIDDVAERLLRSLSGSSPADRPWDPGAVIVVRELRPSDIVEIAKSKPAALITERGGWTSHASILAREFKLPMVSGIRYPERVLSYGDPVIVDALNGEVIVNPDQRTTDHFQAIRTGQAFDDDAQSDVRGETVTLDGTLIAIHANVDMADAYDIARNLGASGIGLFRSESIIRRPGAIPSEDEQVTYYAQVAEAVGEAGVKIRTFDIGIDQAGDDRYSAERNPSLGLRSIRLSLSNPVHFRTQVRAILRAAAGRKIDIVLPMISGVAEVVRSRAIIAEERDKLLNEGIAAGNPRVGPMIEVPSAVLTVVEIARKSDFLCLGTNDLVQYLVAADRDNDAVADWYQTLHPGVIRAIRDVLAAASLERIPVSICGEMAGSPFYVPLLIGLGARELSMNVNSIRHVRHLISGLGVKETEQLAGSITDLETAVEIEDRLREYYLANWSALFPAGLLNAKHR